MIEPGRFFHRPTGRFDWTRQASSARAGVEEVEMIGCGEEVGEGGTSLTEISGGRYLRTRVFFGGRFSIGMKTAKATTVVHRLAFPMAD